MAQAGDRRHDTRARGQARAAPRAASPAAPLAASACHRAAAADDDRRPPPPSPPPRSGVDSLVVVPVAFVSEHIETLEEIDGEYQEVAREAGIRDWERVPALAVDPDFIEDLAEAVVEVLPRLAAPPISAINEGRPVSLRVVNDLVQLRSKEGEIEYGPVAYDGKVKRVGLTPRAELINGRIAMAAITIASVYSWFDGTLIATIMDGRIPYLDWLK